MIKHPHQAPTPATKPYGYGHPHDFVAGLQVIQYRSYQRAISIYHLRTHLLPLHSIRTALQSQKEYLDKLTSFDPLRYFTPLEGDEIPLGCIEAAYLPSVLHGHDSALAFRSDQELGRVEWFVFSGPVDEVLVRIIPKDHSWSLQADVDSDDPLKIFDLVGYAEKGLKTRTVRGANREHKGWHNSLCAAEEGKKNLKLTWRRFGTELRAEQERRRLEAMVEKKDEQRESRDRDTLMDVEERNGMQEKGEIDGTGTTVQGKRSKTTTLNPNIAKGVLPPQRSQRPLARDKAKEQG